MEDRIGARKFRRAERPEGARPIDLHIRVANPTGAVTWLTIKEVAALVTDGNDDSQTDGAAKYLCVGNGVEERSGGMPQLIRVLATDSRWLAATGVAAQASRSLSTFLGLTPLTRSGPQASLMTLR